MSVEIKVPEMGESITEATIANWVKKEGESVKQDEILLELETDKATMEVPAPSSGVLQKIHKKAGETVKVKEIIGLIDSSATASSPSTSAPTNSAQTTQTSGNGTINETLPPAVRKLIEDNGLNPASITGSGKNGQITKEDVLKAIETKATSSVSNASVNVGTPAAVKATLTLPEIPKAVPSVRRTDLPRENVVPMTRLRKVIAERLVSAQHNAAILTTFNEVDMSAVMELRNRYKDKFKEAHNVSLGFMSFFTKAAIHALKTIPAINAEIRGSDIVYKNYYDIGVAVGGPKGLVVPVVRDADLLSFAGVEQEIIRLANRVKDGKIELAEMEGGTFTISNGGIYGSMMSTPILNPPQSGILGLHNIVKRAVVVNDQIVIRPMMYLALSYDHRIVDGKEAVTFLVKVKEAIEDPSRLLLEL
ncbi:dihydrolipoyllysine-residue succinyltransferase, E2 component of oxoglutarate dehydrogenase (succinyl-transferring) complex [Leptospira interrogans serovar Grippotyphosa str. 2006006986]|uniref:Dihydrolipoyllysine-residue succinyltransferase component of 2-oxoglutarate dehydrogenase complex n=1 Tax=Leptospira interrogans str. UI 12758 TaxID=1049938 RepID=A0A0E2D0B2_LEPIR|nr:2-oxoglutarate dehydrogenase complex dihydrolipoyllysine-residue succinyltransferase [Leptospira interrogans]EKO88476.1 dihydrolipoyllysine-residue succinyltransferase, E2 component of oxoglutarate dehydrogenase (succinyl-transferring) complex [Leptospira interrogans serovar Grippotyphosa str. Andaman]EKP84469.1 dihydrolipoyllysine-residue succinyltransferase, E2 component of oxoglutarate dehydrogenase (succinyl-transferring) complex [Leptospira interrogans serovar Grippotyphosa str. 200600698